MWQDVLTFIPFSKYCQNFAYTVKLGYNDHGYNEQNVTKFFNPKWQVTTWLFTVIANHGYNDNFCLVPESSLYPCLTVRPPPNNDGTPSESVDDVYVRSNQLVATIESMYSGENVIIVSPDSDNLSILSAALIDENPDQSLPLHARFWFSNGEVRKLEPKIVPSKLLVTGQTVEEAEENNLKMMVAKIKGNNNKVLY